MHNCMASLGGHQVVIYLCIQREAKSSRARFLQRAGPLAYRVNSHLSGCQTTDKRGNTAEKGGAWDKATL